MNENDLSKIIDAIVSHKNQIVNEISESSISEDDTNLELSVNKLRRKEQLENEDMEEDKKRKKSIRQLKKHLSWATYAFMCIYTILIFIILIFVEKNLNELIYTIPFSMALFGWIPKGLFSE